MTTTTTTTTTTPTKAIVVAANANDANGSSIERNGKNKRAMRLTSTSNTIERITHARSSTSFAHNHHQHHHHREESARDIVRRKRETFLAQMAVDIRKEEIDKLEKRAAQREEALRNAERMLEEDKKRFDLFLKENDERVREATRRAEKEAKKKREKANEVKRLNDEIATARLDLGRREDKLEECEEYLRFLDGLTPKEWLAEFREVEDDGEIGLEGEDGDDGDEEYGRDEDREDEIEQNNKPVPMYFTHPKQLLDVFAKLEEENLTLISEAQDIEDQLERDTERRAKELNQLEMESKRNQMEITRLREAIVEEMQKKKAYGLEASPTSTSSSPSTSTSLSPEQELEDLTEKVREVYESVVVSNDVKPPSIEAVDMLREIEETLERYFVEIEKMPQDVVAERERKIEKERRHRNRELKMQQQKEEQELRLKKAMERAAAPARQKPKGKPVMFRSRLREEKKEKQQNNTQIPKEREAEIELRAFLNREF